VYTATIFYRAIYEPHSLISLLFDVIRQCGHCSVTLAQLTRCPTSYLNHLGLLLYFDLNTCGFRLIASYTRSSNDLYVESL